MTSWVDLAALHNPAPGLRPPAAWGDGIVSNLDFLSATAAARLLTSQTTASTSFVDLATVGPSVTLDTGASVLVIIGAQLFNSSTGDCYMSVAVSGATTVAAAFDNLVAGHAGTGFAFDTGFGVFTGLTPGSNTFTVKYAVSANTGTFARRQIAVIPLR